jgi:hypothetical protein
MRDGAEESFYWVDDGFGYALSADANANANANATDMMALARNVHGQLVR